MLEEILVVGRLQEILEGRHARALPRRLLDVRADGNARFDGCQAAGLRNGAHQEVPVVARPREGRTQNVVEPHARYLHSYCAFVIRYDDAVENIGIALQPHDLTRREAWVLTPLAVAIVLIGIQPNILLGRIEPTVTSYLSNARLVQAAPADATHLAGVPESALP